MISTSEGRCWPSNGKASSPMRQARARVTLERYSWDGLAGGAAEVFQILWKRSAGQGLIEGEVRLRHGPEVSVQQGTEDRFLVRKVMIDVPLRDVGGLGDVTHAGGA